MGEAKRKQAPMGATEALAVLVDEIAGSDPVAVRSARLAELSRDRRAWLGDLTEALDRVLEAVAAREQAIARGEVEAPAEPAPVEEVQASEAPTRQMAAVTDADLESPTDQEVAAAQAPTVELSAVSDTDLEPADPTHADLFDEPLGEPEPDVEEEPVIEEIEPPAEPAAVPPPPPAEVPAAMEPWEDEEPVDDVTPGWTRSAELLFEDALRLFRMGDSDGALISLERLLTATELNEDLREFVRVNEERLLQIYQAVFGTFDRLLTRVEPEVAMPPSFLEVEKVARVLERINGRTTLADMMELKGLTKLESIATVSQLIRAKAIRVQGG